jgi:nicotinamide mononucleotide transporter
VPLWDAAVLCLSLAATYGQARKLLESWWTWIAVDVLSVPLYVVRGLYPTAALYAVFLALCVCGLRAWSRELAAARPGAAPESV